MKILAGSSNEVLAKGIADHLNLPLLPVELSYFANHEKRVWIKDQVRGQNIILVQSFSEPSDEHIMEFLLLADALERLGARHVNLVLPWMGYSLQDKSFREGEPIAAKVVANLVSNAYIKRVFLLDLHNTSTPGFFSIPTQHLSALELFAQYVRNTFDLKEVVVASPDFGGLKRSRRFAEALGVPLVNIDKDRDLQTGEVQSHGLHGNVKKKTVVLFDDVINTGSTVISTAEILKANGASQVHFLATHGLFANQGLKKITASEADSVVITNSIVHPATEKLVVLDVSRIFAEALEAWRGVS